MTTDTPRRGRPPQKECKRGHDLTIAENIRYTKGKRKCGPAMKEYRIRICRPCEKVCRAERAANNERST